MKERAPNKTIPPFIPIGKLKRKIQPILENFDEVEITGGGEPVLHPQIQEILNIFKNKYIKMYTNGFSFKPIPKIDEINISRVHWDSNINKAFYRSDMQNDLEDVIRYYKKYAKKIRIQTILLKGAIDTREKILEFVSKFEKDVDTFMFRTLFPSCNLEKDRFVDYPEDINHPKVKLDTTLDNYDRDLYFVNTDCEIYNKFIY
jgi:molybdenum cofactor biosynthesis enzyme MoaA